MYTFKSRVRYSETDIDRLLSIEGIVNYMQDCSSFQYEDLGMSMEYLWSKKLSWILNSWQLIIERRPRVCEWITIGTLAYGYKDIYGYRNFVIEDQQGNRCAYANTVWVLMNPETCRPTKITEDAKIGYSEEPRIEMNYEDRKIAVPILLDLHDSFCVLREHLDANLHVNNAKYIQMAMEYLPDGFEVRQLRVQYLKSAVLGDVMVPKTGQIDNKYYISLDTIKGRPYAVLEFIQ